MGSRQQEVEDNGAEPTGSRGTLPLVIEAVEVDGDCMGARWLVHDETQLARLIAVIAMGQAVYAAYVLGALRPAAPKFATDSLRMEAIIKLTVQEEKQETRTGYPRWQRDGFMFEAISWIAARQKHGARALIMEPHIKSTSQGIDGLLLKLSRDKSKIADVMIREDKCTDEPRDTFLQKVLPAFLEYHHDRRGAEVVAAAGVLLQIGGFDMATAATLVAAVTNRKKRSYQASFALPTDYDSLKERKRLFKDYNKLDGLAAKQRLGASFIVAGNLREWFDQLADKAIAFLKVIQVEEADV